MWNSCVRVHWQRSSTIGNLFKSPISHCCLRCNFLANGSVGGASSSCYHSIRGTKMRSFIFFFGIILLNCNQATLGFGLLGSTSKVSLDWKEWRHPKEQGASIQSRKQFLDDSKCLVFGAMTGILLPESSVAAAPVTDKETDSLGVMARRALRPKPPKVLRRKLSQDFAVLLMRSSYNALDGLNCVAMVCSAVHCCNL